MDHSSPGIRLLHTSDWHLGRALYGKKRYDEFEAFTDWLATTVQEKGVHVLVVAGDVFDTTTPSNRSQELYYRFLCQVAGSTCRHVVVIGGNHDSPSFLDAPRELLKALEVHVVGKAAESPKDEVLVLKAEDGTPEMIVCAVPYLRDRDIRQVDPGETVQDKELKMAEGIKAHYQAVASQARSIREDLGIDIPIVGTGHLFTAGGTTVEGDGVRDLYEGSLAYVNSAIFLDSFDYTALGHLHVPQKVDGSEVVRYSGSPIPMGFGEAGQIKSLCLVDFNGKDPSVQLVDVPVFQRLERIKGDLEGILKRIYELSLSGSKIWLEIVYDGDEVIGDLRDRLENALSDDMEILRLKDSRVFRQALGMEFEGESLEDLGEDDVFRRLLCAREVPEDQWQELTETYGEIVSSLFEQDLKAE
ncbi:MAG: exonuclease SbcCD subunit D C-terminal domain-containing protein [Dethiosulfovibrio sp.]|nr:exonuclease SbcCD subunit D C-terminal domain-containing protein [Dethiosulfovibrio sp.]